MRKWVISAAAIAIAAPVAWTLWVGFKPASSGGHVPLSDKYPTAQQKCLDYAGELLPKTPGLEIIRTTTGVPGPMLTHPELQAMSVDIVARSMGQEVIYSLDCAFTSFEAVVPSVSTTYSTPSKE